MTSLTKQKHAVIIGGSISGLLAAKVLSDKFETVTIVERDSISSQAADRKGVPQSPQPHILLVKGYRILQSLFPNIETDLLAAGAVPIDWGTDFRYFSFGGWSANSTEATELNSFSCTRPLLESVVRKQVEQIETVRKISPYRVTGLVGNANQVTGIQCSHRHNSSDQKIIQADLIVDASGRSSNANQWLKQIGQTAPTVDVVDAGLGYATQRYRISEDWESRWKVILIGHKAPENNKLGYLAQVENDEFIATLGGYEQQYPPLERQAFLAFAQQLPVADFYEAIAQLTPTSDIKAYRSTANKFHRYDDLSHLPAGFIAIGDAVCALCPAYGQGLTTSAMSALVLQNWINKQSLGNTLTFQKQLAKKLKPAFDMAAGSDSGFVNTKGRLEKSRAGRMMNGYMQRLIKKSHTDSDLNLRLAKISHMVASPLNLFHPKVWMKLT